MATEPPVSVAQSEESVVLLEPSKTREITLKELETHAMQNNAWICLEGKVFDITEYVQSNKHPGGNVPIAKGFGKDATNLFDAVHPHVNFLRILDGKQMGVIKNYAASRERSIYEPGSALKRVQRGKKAFVMPYFCCCFTSNVIANPTAELFEGPCSIVYSITFTTDDEAEMPLESDWTCGILNKEALLIRKMVNKSDVWISQTKLAKRLEDDKIRVRFTNEFRTMEIHMTKPSTDTRWRTLGTQVVPAVSRRTMFHGDNPRIDSRIGLDSFDAYVAYKTELAPMVFLFGLCLRNCAHFGLPIGYHCYICIDGIRKPYTPCCYSVTGKEVAPESPDGQIIWFQIKIYPEGALTPLLHALPVGKPMDEKYPLTLGSPGGNFAISFIQNPTVEVVMLLAGGTGVTPMTQIVAWHYIQAQKVSIYHTHVILMFWNHTDKDIFWKDNWESLDRQSGWFHFVPILTRPPPTWKGFTGRPSNELFREVLATMTFDLKDSVVKQAMICGPPGFNTASEESIKGMVRGRDVHVFAG